MSGDKNVTPPPVVWAQRKSHLWVTFCLEDCKDPTIQVEAEKIYFKGVGGTEHKEHGVTINLYGEVDPEKTVKNAKGRLFEVLLIKKTEGPYWKRLTKEDKKFHWLKCDFNKWKDEDDSDGSDDEGREKCDDFENAIRNMGCLSGDRTGKPNFDDLQDEVEEEDDSDDEDIPPLSEII